MATWRTAHPPPASEWRREPTPEPRLPPPIDRRRPGLATGATGALVLLGAQFGCEPRLEVGSWQCRQAELVIPREDSGVAPGNAFPVAPAWESGFEDGFCGYQRAGGFCYSAPDAEYRLVESPVRSGRFAAAFTITTDDAQDGHQTRCVRQGILPEAAYYGAWFYIPGAPASSTLWNLIHFQGATAGGPLRGLWDVSIDIDADGAMHPRLFSQFDQRWDSPDPDVTLPADAWFHLVIYLQRGAEADGTVALYLDGELLVERTGVTTDDTTWGQWYIGNLANDLNPSESTVYIDDVSIREALDVR